jgi:hypothetical protein
MALQVRDQARAGHLAHPCALPRRPEATRVAVVVDDAGEAAERRVAAHRGGERVTAARLAEEHRGAHHRVVQRWPAEHDTHG